ncbi:serine/threonine protein kinase [Thermomonospora echinospora]|uniref:non-specific serine/threonine protein kinase n=2 Tax=Thermomonospora echinospora TaxID=1992 RepID=A0A1H6DXH9_9ACTN|nr:serine/threonine protein kinase [Thermomonospora echinospora]
MLAVRKSTGTPVAIKYLPPRPGAGQAFRDEARLIAGLDDDTLVRLHEHAESPHGVALVGELVNGISLERLIKAEGRLAPEAALVIFKTVLLALGAVHRTGLVHGAVTPGNVLVDGDGNGKLAGLGVTAWTGAPAAGGSPHYQAPELRYGGRVTPAADIYAATAVLYECLTGEPPTGGTGTARPHEAPGPLVPLLTAGLAGNPDDRPVTARVFLGRLETVASAAYGPGWQERGRALLVERAAVLTLLFPLSRKMVSDEKARAAAFGKAGRRRARGGVLAVAAAALMLLAGTGAVVYAAGGSGGGGDALPGVSASSTPSAEAPAPVGLGPTGGPSTKLISPSPKRSASPDVRGGGSRSPDDRPSDRPSQQPSSPGPSTSPPSPGQSFVATAVQVIALSLDSQGTVATAQVKVTGSGKGQVTVSVQFYAGEAAHGSAETLTVTVDGETTVQVSHSYDTCPGAYAGQATAAPGAPAAHRLAAEGQCTTA